jgi:sn-1 stearoyl-lipid 9-desaturase
VVQIINTTKSTRMSEDQGKRLNDYLLIEPHYGWADAEGNFIKPTLKQILKEYLTRINIFKDSKAWFPFMAWFWVLCLLPFMLLLLFKYFTWPLFIGGMVYGMVIMGSHGTMWYHRYSTHNAFTFKNSFWKFVSQHIVIKVIPEELYVVSHHIHHEKSDMPGDPYNAFGGFFYCFFADTNHQLIKRDLTPEDYNVASKCLQHTGARINTYEEYLKYGTITNPWYIMISWVLNWSFWGLAFFFLGEAIGVTGGGMAMVCAVFGGTFVWSVGIRTFNYEGHGKGAGKNGWGSSDLNRKDYSINQLWPGYVAGEWHNNHHLFPTSSRSGFLPYQMDLPWMYVKFLHWLGGITEYRDNKKQFLENYYKPFKENQTIVDSSALPVDLSGR